MNIQSVDTNEDATASLGGVAARAIIAYSALFGSVGGDDVETKMGLIAAHDRATAGLEHAPGKVAFAETVDSSSTKAPVGKEPDDKEDKGGGKFTGDAKGYLKESPQLHLRICSFIEAYERVVCDAGVLIDLQEDPDSMDLSLVMLLSPYDADNYRAVLAPARDLLRGAFSDLRHIVGVAIG